MTGPFHTLAYPVALGATRQGLSLPAKTPQTIRHYAFDFGPFVTDAGTTVASAFLLADPTLAVTGAQVQGNLILFTVSAGVSVTPLPVISFAVMLADGSREDVTIVQPIEDLSPPIPAGAIAVVATSPTAFTAAVFAALFASLPTAPPSGPGQPWNNGGLVSFSAGSATGTGNITTAMLTAALTGLPTAAPTGAGQPWNDGGVIAFTAGSPGGSSVYTAADLAAVFATLPTSAPGATGQPWNNGHILAST